MLTHKGTQIIETQRLILRPFTMDDAEPMFRNWASDDRVTHFLSWPSHRSVADTEPIVAAWAAADEHRYKWAITLKSNGSEPIGSICVTRHEERTRMAHMGYALGFAWWGQGFMSEALEAVIDYLFDEIGFNRIESCHDIHNHGSGAVMRKCGMLYEGRKRQSHFGNLGLHDVDCYAILASDPRKRNL